MRFVHGLVIGLLVGGLVAVSAAYLVQKEVLVQSDRSRGEQFREAMADNRQRFTPRHAWNRDRGFCQFVAEITYGEVMLKPRQGNPSRSQQAFYEGCSGDDLGSDE